MDLKNDFRMKITSEAANEIVRIREENKVPQSYGLRITAKAGGCCGISYLFNFEDKPKESDAIIKSDNITVFIDTNSIKYLQGSILHFVESPDGDGFVFNNPNEMDLSGCNGGCCN